MSSDRPDNSSMSDGWIAFAARAPSTNWETVELSTQPPRTIWVWFKPPHLPDAILLQFPPDDSAAVPVTVRELIRHLGIDPTRVFWCVLYSERSDQDDWQEARRALRDAAARLGRYIKEMDAGETVYAGKKRWFDNIRKSYVIPRITFDGMEAARQEFEVYRSTMQNLANRMQSACHHARQEGEVRAQQVLNRIAVKVTSSRNRR